jgi:hypothetical protein
MRVLPALAGAFLILDLFGAVDDDDRVSHECELIAAHYPLPQEDDAG